MRISPLLLLAAALGFGCSRPAAPVLSAINPGSLPAEFGGAITLEGAGFLPAGVFDFDRPDASTLSSTVSASMEQGSMRVDLMGVTWRDAQRVEAAVPAGLAVGAWTVRLVTPRGEVLTLVDGLRLVPYVTDAGLLLDGGLPDGGLPDGGSPDGGDPDAGFDAGFDAGPQPCTDFTYADDDGDTYGRPDSGAFLCGSGRAPDAGDCNDVDTLSSPAGVEVCNGLDDDCDGVIDDGVCTDAGLVRLTNLLDPNNDFMAASVFSPEQLWVAGGQRLYVRRSDGTFTNASANCPMNLTTVWSAAEDWAFVGGGNNGVGRLTTATRTGGCVTAQLLPEPAVGLFGYTQADGGAAIEAVLRDGRWLRWDGVGAPVVQGSMLPVTRSIVQAHASALGTWYAVGGIIGTPVRPVIYRMGADGTFTQEPLPAGVPDGWLRSVWTLSPTEAVAVGEGGMALRRIWGRWELISTPQPWPFTAARAFGPGRVYASTDAGSLLQWTGDWVERPTLPRPVHDLEAFDEEHFWLVGDDGLVIKGPQLP